LREQEPIYNLHTRRKNWLTNVALEAETAITRLPNHDRDFYRRQIVELIKTLHLWPYIQHKIEKKKKLENLIFHSYDVWKLNF
jgi:hypothetical protein